MTRLVAALARPMLLCGAIALAGSAALAAEPYSRPGSQQRPALADPQPTRGADDRRRHLNEYQLKDINRRLANADNQEIVVHGEPELTYTGKGVVLKKRTVPDTQALRGNLHRLRREVRETQSPHTRRHPLEDQLENDG